jgi:hypothetical protein
MKAEKEDGRGRPEKSPDDRRNIRIVVSITKNEEKILGGRDAAQTLTQNYVTRLIKAKSNK